MSDVEFVPFDSIPRLKRNCIITEKIDGTNAQVYIGEDGEVRAGSRNRWITPLDDNYGFASWVEANKGELAKLGPGRHYGEWWGAGIQRRYGLDHKRFSLFNSGRWSSDRPGCCGIVPVLYAGPFTTEIVDATMASLAVSSVAAPGFANPEGIVVYIPAAKHLYKVTFDDRHKGEANA